MKLLIQNTKYSKVLYVGKLVIQYSPKSAKVPGLVWVTWGLQTLFIKHLY